MDMFALLKQIDPPLGFGSKCPDLLAYKRLVRMNMPVDVEGKVHFTSTLFALVRVNLNIFIRWKNNFRETKNQWKWSDKYVVQFGDFNKIALAEWMPW